MIFIKRSLNARYALMQGLYWSAFCVLFPFFVPYFRACGYGDLQIGVISMCQTAVLTVAQPLWGALCDRAKKVKYVFILALSLAAAASLLLPAGARSVSLMTVAVMLLAGTGQALYSIIDTWAVRLRNDGAPLNYGFTRSFGSAFYAITAVLFGMALDRFGMGLMTPAFLILSLALAAITLTINDAGKSGAPRPRMASGAAALFRNKSYLALLVSVFFTFFGSAGAYLFFPLRMSEIGGPNGVYGLALFVMAMSEVPALMLYNRFAGRRSSAFLIAASMFFMTLKIACMAFSPAPWIAVATQALQGPSYGIFLSAAANYIPEIVPRETVFTAQTLMASVAAGLAGICSNIYMGALSSALGTSAAMGTLVAFPAAGFVIFAAYSASKRKKSHET